MSFPASSSSSSLRRSTQVHFMPGAAPRPGKPLLVLDLDHTLLDFTTRAGVSAARIKRPHMDAFLAAVYERWDIGVWSQTHW